MRSLVRAITVGLQKVIGLPMARVHHASAQDSLDAEDWETVIRHAEAVHRWQWPTDESRFMLGCAYAKVNRFEAAVEELRAIRRPLRVRKCEQERWLNLAVSLDHLGEVEQALALLPADEIGERFPDYAEPARELRDMLAKRVEAIRAYERRKSDGRQK